MKYEQTILPITLALLLFAGACVTNTSNTSAPNQTTPSPSVSPTSEVAKNAAPQSQITLPVLDALLGNDDFVGQLKNKLQLTDDQIQQLKRTAQGEVDRLRTSNAEESSTSASGEGPRAGEQISTIVGTDKANQLSSLANEFWSKGGDIAGSTDQAESLPIQPNSVPSDTRIVVNIPAYRMDLFKDGSLVKTYKIGIGYPEFPLPQGLRKAQTIIFNPTWTPPDSPWVAKMKDITPGEKIEAGSKLNPLGPIKVPIGLPSLIHGGKAVNKLGTFASHGCVGLTNAQVKDFARHLGQLSGTELNDNAIASYLKNPTETHAVKLKQPVPVELRYETIVAEDGNLHIYKDVYAQDTNTEDNVRKVLEANGARLEDLSPDERNQVLTALNAMSSHPKQQTSPSPSPSASPISSKKQGTEKKAPKNQKEIVIQLGALAQRGYPPPVNFDTGTGKSIATATRR